ncbi:hypothetical protein CIRG_05161 [Coccidioides immitis RMSCC 2394]|uniref:Uncharacterized protein n=1 Tax=Coccidioides immitis RMSCC 2394 TaxID=404692 RepID=A0A0J6YCP7_COCIT|nr:hypothetical protein CIRG_05161 [Coccidioides immitis RMSCC 2394]
MAASYGIPGGCTRTMYLPPLGQCRRAEPWPVDLQPPANARNGKGGGKMEDAWNHFILRGVGLASGRGLFTSALKRAGESRMWPFMYPPARADLQNPQRMICATGNRRALIRGRSHSTMLLFPPKPRR